MTGGITTEDLDESSFVERVRSAPVLDGRDLVREVTPHEPYDADVEALLASGRARRASRADPDPRVEGAKVAAIDLGMKRNILRCLVGTGFTTRVFGASHRRAGDPRLDPRRRLRVATGRAIPSAVPYVAETLRAILGRAGPGVRDLSRTPGAGNRARRRRRTS